MLLKVLILLFLGAAKDSLHLEKPRFIIFSIKVLLNKDFSIRTFSPTIARSASPFETKEGISSLLTNRISMGKLLDLANKLSPFVEKLIPDFLIKSVL
jgi:hypothetical protein